MYKKKIVLNDNINDIFYPLYLQWVKQYAQDHSVNPPYEQEIKFYLDSVLRYRELIIPPLSEYLLNISEEKYIIIYDLGCGSGILSVVIALHLLKESESNEALNKEIKKGNITIKGIDILDYSQYWKEALKIYNQQLEANSYTDKKIDINFLEGDYFKILRSEDLSSKNRIFVMSQPHHLAQVVDIAYIIKNNKSNAPLFFDYYKDIDIIQALKNIPRIKKEKIEILEKGCTKIDSYEHPTIHDLKTYYFVWQSASHQS
ncbi:MAG: hypothetical protein GXN99_01150 [Candidatus Nanohaloarchaeota archaeon]|nr:hypothetical protein [Candidatus Nanohaloarchaeota archaeon]